MDNININYLELGQMPNFQNDTSFSGSSLDTPPLDYYIKKIKMPSGRITNADIEFMRNYILEHGHPVQLINRIKML